MTPRGHLGIRGNSTWGSSDGWDHARGSAEKNARVNGLLRRPQRARLLAASAASFSSALTWSSSSFAFWACPSMSYSLAF